MACGGAGVVWLLLAAGVGGPVGVALAAAETEPACRDEGQGCVPALPLDQLSLTIGSLKASLSAIRQDLETMQDGAASEDPGGAIAERLCAAPLAEANAARDAATGALEQLRATIASERDAAAADRDELAAVRERLTSADTELARLKEDRAKLMGRIGERDAVVEKVRSREAGTALAESPPQSPIASVQAAELDAAAERQLMLPVVQRGPAALASPRQDAAAAGIRPGAPVDRLQLQAELALAQLKIAELTTALESARLHQEQIDAEVSTLRSLTDAKIKQLMGWK